MIGVGRRDDGWGRAWRRLPATLLLLVAACGPAPGSGWRPCAYLRAPEIAECSGIVKSRRAADLFWVHNDSGDTPRLFAIDSRGQLLCEVAVEGAKHVDWEDIATDDAGNLYVGDFGNNRNARRDLTIYVLREPEVRPLSKPYRLTVSVERQIRFRFPEQRAFPDPEHMNFDCESLAWHGGSLYVLTKHRSDTRTVLHRLSLHGDGEQVATRLGEYDLESQATGADISPDGRELLVLTYQYIYLFERPRADDNYLAGRSRRMLIEGRQCESICFDRGGVVFANEQREIFCLAPGAVGRQRPFLPPPPRLAVSQLPLHADGSPDWESIGPLRLHQDVGASGRGRPPEIRLAWLDSDLRLHVRWRPDPPSRAGPRMLSITLGPERPRGPQLAPEDRVFDARIVDGVIAVRESTGRSTTRGDIAARHLSGTDYEVMIPLAPAARARRGAQFRFNVLVVQPGVDGEPQEWSWAGSSSTQPLANPLLWGRATLESAP